MIKFIYFDLGDVCYTYPHPFSGVAKKFGHTEEDYRRIFVANGKEMGKGRITVDDLWQIMRKELCLTGGEDFDFTAYWLDQYVPRLDMHTFIIDISKSFRIGLLTNNFPGMRDELFSRGLVPKARYEAVIFSNETGMRKPEPEIYELARKKTGLTPPEILLVDDRQDFIDGAKRAGWKTVAFDTANPQRSMREIRELITEQ